MRIKYVSDRKAEVLGPRIAALEGIATYPLGDDQFKIDHGLDYFAFFRRLGKICFYVALNGSDVVGVGAGILRRIPHRDLLRSAWYLCDLKVHPDSRGQRISLKLMTRAFPFNYLRCRRGYAISMNPATGANRVVGLLKRFRWARLSEGGQLLFFSWDAAEMRLLRATLEAALGRISFLSLDHCKRLMLQSTGSPMPLLHIQHGPCAEPGFEQPQDGFVHMLCTPSGSALHARLAQLGLQPTASASIIQHGLSDQDWGFILTSDI